MAANLDVALNIQANVTGATNIEQINDALSDQRIAALQAASASQDLSTAEGQAARIAIDAALAAERQARALESQARAARAAANAAAAVPNQTPAQQAAAAAAEAHANALEQQASAARANATALGQQASAANNAANANNAAGNAAGGAAAGFGKMLGALASITVAMAGLGKLVEIADGFKLMESRVELATEKLGDSTQAMTDVRAIANDVGVSLDAIASLYGKVAIAADQLGLSQANVAQFTQTLAKAFAVSGASAAEMEGSLRQLAQALSSGALRGDEFNSIMEGAPRIQQALADSLQVTKGELRSMAEEGKLSAEVVTSALLGQSSAIDAEFGKLPDTVGKAAQAVANEFDRFVATLNDGTGATAAMAAALRGLAGVFTDIQVFGIDTAQIFTDLAARFNYVIDILNTPIDGNTFDAVAERTRQLDAELKNITAEYGVLRDAAIKAGEAGANVSDQISKGAPKALSDTEKLTQALKSTGDEGSKAGNAIKEAFAGIDVSSTGGVLSITAAMRDAGTNAKLLGDQITEWVNKANNADLSQFQQSVQAAFDAGALKADEFARYNDEILGASFKRLGLNAETELGRITPAINEGLQTLGTLSLALENSLDAPEAKMRALEQATAALIEKAKSNTDVAALAANIERMGKAGELSAEGVKRAIEALEAQRVEIAKGAGGVKSLEDQYKALGVTSVKALNDAAAAAASLYAQSVNAKAPIYEQAQAYTKLVQTQLAAAAAQGQAALSAKIAMFEATASTKEQRAEVARLKTEYEKKPAPVEIPAPDTTAFKAGINDAKSAVDGLIAAVANAKNQTELRQAQDQITAAFNEGTISSEEYTRALGAVDDQSRQLRQEIAAAATYLDGMTDSMKKASAAIWTGNTATQDIRLQMQGLLETLQSGGFDSATADLERQNVSLAAQADSARKAANEWAHMFDITSRAGGADYVGAIVAQAKMSEIMAEQAIRANELKIAQINLAASIREIKSAVDDGSLSLTDQSKKLAGLRDQYSYLNDTDLSALKSEIDAVNGKIQSGIDKARDLEASLKQEQARSRGDDVTAVRLQNDEKIQNIEQQIEEARRAGNNEALRYLQSSLDIQKDLADQAEREARAKMEAAKQSSSTAPSANGGTIQTTRTESANKTSVDVTIKSDGAGLGQLDRKALDDLARQLAPIITQQKARGLN